MKIILMGTSVWVIPIFERASREHNVVAVFTRAPRPSGRKKILTPSPVNIWAAEKNIPVYTDIKSFPPTIDFGLTAIDCIVVASYGVILRDNILNFARLGCINIHPSLLPKYRGPSPMLSAIINGDTESGVCLMKLTTEIDAGDIYNCEKFAIGENDTNATLENIAGKIGAEMLSRFLANPEKFPPKSQSGEPTFSRKFTGDDEWINWNKSPQQIHNQIRSIGGRTNAQIGDEIIQIKILETKINSVGTLEIMRLQPSGKNPMSWRDFLNGTRGQQIEFINATI